MMLDGCAYGIAIFDSQSQFIASNRNWKETIGNAIKDSDGHGQFELLSGLSKLWRSSCLECLQSKEEKKIEEEVQWANGTSEWIRWHIRPWVGEINKDEGYTVSFHSIDTEKSSNQDVVWIMTYQRQLYRIKSCLSFSWITRAG